MKISVNLYLPMLFVLFVFACGGGSGEAKVDLKGLEEEVIAIHDEVMPMMGKVRKLASDLEQVKNSINVEGTEVDAEALAVVESGIEALNQANDGMNQWMKGFSEKMGEKRSADEQLVFLNGEKEKVSAVKEAILTSIENAENLLKAQTELPE